VLYQVNSSFDILRSSLRNLCALCVFLETNAELTEELNVAALPLTLRKASGFPENVWHCCGYAAGGEASNQNRHTESQRLSARRAAEPRCPLSVSSLVSACLEQAGQL